MSEEQCIVEDDSGPDGRGWVKLHRQLLGSAVFMNEGLLKVWLWCLLKATHRTLWRPMQTGRGMTQVELRPGQFIFGRKIAAAELGMPESTVRNRMQRLVELDNISAQPDTHCSIVTICNWQTYQEPTDAKGQATDRQRTTKGHIQEQKQHKEDVPDRS